MVPCIFTQSEIIKLPNYMKYNDFEDLFNPKPNNLEYLQSEYNYDLIKGVLILPEFVALQRVSRYFEGSMSKTKERMAPSNNVL